MKHFQNDTHVQGTMQEYELSNIYQINWWKRNY